MQQEIEGLKLQNQGVQDFNPSPLKEDSDSMDFGGKEDSLSKDESELNLGDYNTQLQKANSGPGLLKEEDGLPTILEQSI